MTTPDGMLRGEIASVVFKECLPPFYDGSPREHALGDFLHQTIESFKIVNIAPSEFVALTVPQLKGAAALWWESKNLDVETTTWSYFVEAIANHFDRLPKMRRFSERVDRWSYEPGESVASYTDRFHTELLPSGPVMVSSHWQMKIYWEALPHALRTRMVGPDFYEDLDMMIHDTFRVELEIARKARKKRAAYASSPIETQKNQSERLD